MFSFGIFLSVMDILFTEMDIRYQSYNHLNQCSGFVNNISSLSAQELCNRAANHQKNYLADLDVNFIEEIYCNPINF